MEKLVRRDGAELTNLFSKWLDMRILGLARCKLYFIATQF